MKNIKIFKALLFSVLTLLATSIFAAMQHNSPAPGAVMTDTAITAVVKTRIATDKDVSNSNINVSTNNAVVTLTGNVDSDSQASTAIALAESAPGVKDVDASGLNVKESTQPYADTVITGKIKGLFLREKIFAGKDIAAMAIHVETRNGVVYLTGTADNHAQIRKAIKIAHSVKGVTRVQSSVKVTK
jgi:hyperosmotically inducible protein